MTAEPASIRTEELLEHAGWLCALAASLVSDRSSADDVVQETWLAALRHRPQRGTSLRPWLARVAQNLARNAKRGSVRRADRESLARDVGESIAPDDIASEVEIQRLLAEAVSKLDEPLRTTTVLRYFRGLNASEIAQAQGVPSGTVRWRLKRAIDALREDLDHRYGDRASWCLALTALLPTPGAVLKASSAATAAGVSIMTTSTKVGIAALLAVCVGVAAWQLSDVESHTRHAPLALAEPFDSSLDEPEIDATAANAIDEAGREQVATAEPAASPPAPLERAPLVADDCCIIGRVVDEAGQPVLWQGFYVRPVEVDDGALLSLHDPSKTWGQGNTRASGVFAIPVPPGQPFAIFSTVNKHLATFAKSPCFAGETHEIVMTAGATLHASVVTPRDGGAHPVKGAPVSAHVFVDGRECPWLNREGTTDARGQVVLARIPAATIHVRSRTPQLGLQETILVSTGTGELHCELVFAPSATLQGSVIDASNGLPIRDGRIAGHGLPEAFTLDDGTFEIPGVRPEASTRSIAASKPGYATEYRYVTIATSGVSAPLHFQLEPAQRAHGRVVDARRTPIADARVRVVARLSTEPFLGETQQHEVLTDAEGRFELDELQRETPYRLVVLADDHGAGVFTAGPFPRSSPAADLGDLALARPGSIAGRIERPAQPDTRWLVRLIWNGDSPHAAPERDLAHLASTRPDSSGRFAFPTLGPGSYRLHLVELPTGGKRSEARVVDARTVALEAGQSIDDVLFLHSASIRGRIVDTRGSMLGDCRVSLHDASADTAPLAVATADETGRFQLPVESDGPFRLVIDDPRLFHESKTVTDVRADVSELRIVLDPFHSNFAIRGRLVDPSGQAPERVYVAFTDTTTGQQLGRVALPDESGRFEMKDLRDVPYDLELVDFGNLYEPATLAAVRPSQGDAVLQVERRE